MAGDLVEPPKDEDETRELGKLAQIAENLETTLLHNVKKLDCSAAMIQAARQYLKDQGWVNTQAHRPHIPELEVELKKRERKKFPFPTGG